MTHISKPGSRAERQHATASPRTRSGTGWSTFAGALLVLVGGLLVLEGVVALLDDGFFQVRADELVIKAGYVAWGWVHVISGLVFVVTGAGVIAGGVLAKIVGVVLAGLGAIVNLVFVPAQPLWASIIVACNVFVIYALVVHDEE